VGHPAGPRAKIPAVAHPQPNHRPGVGGADEDVEEKQEEVLLVFLSHTVIHP